MAKSIQRHFIDDLVNRTDLVALVGSRISISKTENGRSWACCPFHNEKSPSFAVNHAKQFYYCFGCHAGGDALRFIMDYEHVSFVEAVEILAAFNGVEVQYEEQSPQDAEEFQARKAKLELGLEALADAAAFYHQQFYAEVGQGARAYLRQRQLSKTSVEQYQIGYAPQGNPLIAALEPKYGMALLLETGLAGEKDGRYYDWFRDRVMFPIHNRRGQVVGFGARAMGDAQPKYLNSGESPWFNKRYELYGLYQALQSRPKSLIVTEGYMDVVKLAQFGFRHAVAALGTAVGETHIAQLKKRTPVVYFCFDGDHAGEDAAKKALQAVFATYDGETDWRFVFLPPGEDPDSLLTSQGQAAFHRALDGQISASQFVQKLLNFEARAHWTVEEKTRAAQAASQWVSLLPAGQYRDILRQELQQALNAPIDILSSSKEGAHTVEKTVQQSSKIVNAAAVFTKAEWRMAAILILHPEWQKFPEVQVVLPEIIEKFPLLAQLLYLARCGGCPEQLAGFVAQQGLAAQLQRATETVTLLSEADLQSEWRGMMQRLQQDSQDLRTRLEKLGG